MTRLRFSRLGLALVFVFSTYGTALAEEVDTQAAKSPKDVCTALVDAAKKEDFDTVKKWTTGWTKDMHSKTGMAMSKSKFHKMHQQQMDKIKETSCGSEHLAGTRAFVESESKGEKRFIPFVQQDGVWKFDAKVYMTMYQGSIRSHASEDAKWKKGDDKS